MFITLQSPPKTFGGNVQLTCKIKAEQLNVTVRSSTFNTPLVYLFQIISSYDTEKLRHCSHFLLLPLLLGTSAYLCKRENPFGGMSKISCGLLVLTEKLFS